MISCLQILQTVGLVIVWTRGVSGCLPHTPRWPFSMTLCNLWWVRYLETLALNSRATWTQKCWSQGKPWGPYQTCALCFSLNLRYFNSLLRCGSTGKGSIVAPHPNWNCVLLTIIIIPPKKKLGLFAAHSYCWILRQLMCMFYLYRQKKNGQNCSDHHSHFWSTIAPICSC